MTKTKKTKVMEYMQTKGEISQREAIWIGCYRLAAVIFDLKKRDGIIINTEYREVNNLDGSKSRVAFYSLPKNGDGQNG